CVTSGSLFLTADAFCNSNYNGHLMSIPNAFVNTFIAQTIDLSNTNETFSRYWIGVNDIAGTGWTNIDDGSNITYFDWASGESANSTESNGCVSVDLKGLWHNDDCFTSYSFVCEVPEVEIQSTTTLSPVPDICEGVDCGNGICIVAPGNKPVCKCYSCYQSDTNGKCTIHEPNPCDQFGEYCSNDGTCAVNSTDCSYYCKCNNRPPGCTTAVYCDPSDSSCPDSRIDIKGKRKWWLW
ncbi:hypothetical protein FO519_009700, partial [Halicephalobus sp. NKZ332]